MVASTFSLAESSPILYIPGAFIQPTFTPIPCRDAPDGNLVQCGLAGQFVTVKPAADSGRQIFQILSAETLRQSGYTIQPVATHDGRHVVITTNDESDLGRDGTEKTNIWAASRRHLLEFDGAVVHPATTRASVTTRIGETVGDSNLTALTLEKELDRFSMLFQPFVGPLADYQIVRSIGEHVRILFETIEQATRSVVSEKVTIIRSYDIGRTYVPYQEVLGLYIPERFAQHDCGIEVSILCQHFSIEPRTGVGFTGVNDRSHLYVSARIGTFDRPFTVDISEHAIDLTKPSEDVARRILDTFRHITAQLSLEADAIIDILRELRK